MLCVSVALLSVAVVSAIVAKQSPDAPNVPAWPHQFSASILLLTDDFPRPIFARWFASSGLDKERIDGMAYWEGQEYFAERIFDVKKGVEHALFYQLDSVTCISRNFNASSRLPLPNLHGAQFAGQTEINGEWADHWVLDTNEFAAQYFTFNSEPLKWQVTSKQWPYRSYEANFHEFDTGSQDPNLFVVPSNILPHCIHVH